MLRPPAGFNSQAQQLVLEVCADFPILRVSRLLLASGMSIEIRPEASSVAYALGVEDDEPN